MGPGPLLGPGLADLAATPVLALALARLVAIDLREHRLPDRLTLPLLALGLALGAWRAGGVPGAELIGAAAGLAVFAALGSAHHALRGREGLGLGDAKLLAAAGAWLGWRPLPALVLAASLAALAWTAARGVRGPLAFGPWLALAFLGLWLLRLADFPPAATFLWPPP